MSATIDPELLKLVRQHVSLLSTDVEKMKFEHQKEMNNVRLMCKNIERNLQELEKWCEKLEGA